MRKVPVTVLSRCQRFDLRRVEAGRAASSYAGHRRRGGDRESSRRRSRLIARAAEGSARDGLSLLDQAMVQAGGDRQGRGVRDMLGLADRAETIDLFEKVTRGETAEALAA